MKKYFLLLFLSFSVGTNLFAQSEVITRRDDRYLRENAVVNLLNSYEISMNVITAGEAFPNEIKTHIEKIITGGRNERIFFGELVRIENDLTPGAELLKTKEDKVIKDYLDDLVSLYKNPEANSIVFDKNYKISNLKRTGYFYYNVVFNCTFKGVNIDNKPYNTVTRVAEIRLVSDDGKWYPYINGIRFFNEPGYNIATDTLNVYADFPASVGDNEDYIDYLSKLNAEKSKFYEERDKEVRILLEESKHRLEEGNVSAADSLISKAWITNPSDRLVLSARANLKTEKERITKEKKEREEKIARMNEIKEKIKGSYYSFDFITAKQWIDTLNFNYTEKKDTTIEKINNDLVVIHTTLDPILNAISVRRYKDALKYCDNITRKNEKNLLTIECYYQRAVTLMKMDSLDNMSKVYENLNEAINASQKRHTKALALRAALKRNQKKYDESLSDISFLVNMHSNNPEYYALRASVYDLENRKTEAITDYATAIKLKTTDPMAFAGKARLEFEKGQYADVISTCTDAIAKTNPVAEIYYYRALAYEKTSDFKLSGNDFANAKKLRLDTTKTAAFKAISKNYFTSGKAFFDKSNFRNAIDDLSKSLLLDTMSDALYWLGKAYRSDNQLEKSEHEFTALINLYPDYNGAYFERGIVRRSNNKLADAVRDFNTEYGHAHTKQPLLEKIRTEMQMLSYEDAAKDAENEGRIFYDPLGYQYATESWYKAKRPDKVIEIYAKAETARYLATYTCYYYARALYDNGDAKKAKSFFDKAYEMDKTNADAAYWSGSILFQNLKYDDALSMFQQAVMSAEFGNDACYFSAICRIKLKMSNGYKLAANDLDKIKNTKKYQTAETLSWLAYCQLYLNDDLNARNILKEAQALDSTNTVYSFASACYYSKTHDPVTALDFLTKALGPGSKFTKGEIEKETYLEELRNKKEQKDRYKALLKSRFN